MDLSHQITKEGLWGFFFFPPQRKLVGIVVLWKVRDIGAQAVVNTEMKSVKQSNDTTVDVKY